MNRVSPRIKLSVLFVAVLVIMLVSNIIWSSYLQHSQAEKEMLEKAQILSQELDAAWEFMELNQDRINTDANGTYEFKGLYCVVAGKSISKLITVRTDYIIHYTNLTTRRKIDAPDTFEKEALNSFLDNPQATEYYAATNYEGEQVFRYAAPLKVTESCLECHGEPAGEPDVFGFPKEGQRLGDLAGAISIVMPVETYMGYIQDNITSQVIFFSAILVVCFAAIFFSTSHLVKKQTSENIHLQEENQYKSDFLAIMSHELRTPLTSILAFTEIWEKSDEHKSEKEETTIKEIKGNGQILLQMINNILEMARAEAGRVELTTESIEMVDLVNTVEKTIGFLAERKDIELATTVSTDVPIIVADWEKLRRIIENLTSNAIKFTQRGGSVRVAVDYDPEQQQVVIVVQDTGVGIPEEDMPHIFNKFIQSDKSSNRRYSGSGLGLAVVKELVELHNGGIEVVSTHKVGSTFVVRIPAILDELE